MPFDIKQDKEIWQVYNTETGDIKGEHETEEEAKEQLKALYANVEDVQKAEGERMEQPIFIPIQKVNLERREVWGWGAVEEPDNADEIMDYESSKPYFTEWSTKAQKRSGGKSMGNLRSMHQKIAAGKIIDLRADDIKKGFFVGAKIVDDGEWKKVTEGVYTGFSVGGSYQKRWMDYKNPGKVRYTAKPNEISIVDSPCIPSATFEVVKADGSSEYKNFMPGTGNMLQYEEEDFEKYLSPFGNINKIISEGGLSLDEKFDLMKTLATDIIEHIDDLQKANIPGAPEKISDIDLPSKVGGDFEVEHMPEPNTTLSLEMDSTPAQDALASAAVTTKDLSEAFESWLPKIGAAVAKAVQNVIAEKIDLSLAPAKKMIKVKQKQLIKVNRKE